ncbi:hypothetical protein Tco_1412363, partial [Tanacetum coccineum]
MPNGVIGTKLLTMRVLGDVCSLAFDLDVAFEDASNACALANIHALAFEMSEKEGFASLSLPLLSLYPSDKYPYHFSKLLGGPL